MVKTYGQIIYRDGPDGEKIPFKVSAKTLVVYKEFTGNDLISDILSVCNIKLKECYSLTEKEIANKTKNIEKNIDDTRLFEIMRNLILCARLAAYPTTAEMEEAMALGDEILPLQLLVEDTELGSELMSLILGDIKKKIK